MKLFWFLLGSMTLFYCSDNTGERNYSYLKSPDGFVNPSEFPETNPNPQKYFLAWRNPTDTNKFQGNRIYLDTTNWKEIVDNPDKSKGAVLFLKPSRDTTFNEKKTKFSTRIVEEDTVLFSFGSSGDPVQLMDENYMGYPWYQFDTSGMGARLDSTDFAFNFALVSVYPGEIGTPRFSEIIVDDKFPPEKLQTQRDVKDRYFTLGWKRPRDKVSFFNNIPEADTGIISGYHLIIKNVIKTDEALVKLKIDSMLYVKEGDSLTYSGKRAKNPGFNVTKISADSSLVAIYDIFLEDGLNYKAGQKNMLFQLYGLKDLHQYAYQFYAVDEFGNRGTRGAELLNFTTTDTTAPINIKNFKADSIGINTIELSWAPTRDSRPGDASSDQNILSYHLVKMRLPDSSSKLRPDSLAVSIDVSSNSPKSVIFNQSRILAPDGDEKLYRAYFYYLPPGQPYEFKLYAEDSSKHKSEIATLNISTLSADTAFSCPAGYKLVSGTNSEAFCMEEYEHRDSSGKFTGALTIEEAAKTCSDLSDVNDSTSHFYLCSETQWVRACKGRTGKHLYGIQSLDELGSDLGELSNSTSLLQTHCNQGAGDEDMAFSEDLRNGICITNEGIFDLSGNLSEWVATADSGTLPPRFKGGNYLRPQINVAELQKKALCDAPLASPKQKRPAYVPECVSEFRNVAVKYKHPSNIDSVFCPEIQSPVKGSPVFSKGEETVNGIKVSRDSVYMTLNFNNGDSKKYKIRNITGADSNKFNGVEINEPILLEVVFSNDSASSLADLEANPNLNAVLDTLDYRGFVYFDSLVFDGMPSDHPLLRNEINESWQAFPKALLYGFVKPYPETAAQNFKDAKAFYQFKAIGFRCCAAAIPTPPPPEDPPEETP